MPQDREAHRLYMRERRAGGTGGFTGTAVNRAESVNLDSEPAGAVAAVAAVAAAVAAELAKLPDRGQGRPGLAAVAVTLAQLLDDVTARPQHPAAAGRLREVLAELRQGQAGPGAGKLAQLRAAKAARGNGIDVDRLG